jgi:hypothetical protein
VSGAAGVGEVDMKHVCWWMQVFGSMCFVPSGTLQLPKYEQRGLQRMLPWSAADEQAMLFGVCTR